MTTPMHPTIAWFRSKINIYAINPIEAKLILGECDDLDDTETIADMLEMFGYPELAVELNATLTP